MDGRIYIECPLFQICLVISPYIGYTTRKYPSIIEDTEYQLKEDTKVLDEVVVVGYGVQKKSH